MARTLGILHRNKADIAKDLKVIEDNLAALQDEAERKITPLLPSRRTRDDFIAARYGRGSKQEELADKLIDEAERALNDIRREFDVLLETSFDDNTRRRISDALDPVAIMAGSALTNYKQFCITHERLQRAVDDLIARLPYYADPPAPQPASPQISSKQQLNPAPSPEVRILFLAANPLDTVQLRLDEEVRSIGDKLRASRGREVIRLDQAWALRADDIIQELNERRPHVVHFSGHGSSTSEIILQNAQGESKAVPPKALAALFATMKDNIRIVVLNACYSEQQALSIAQSVDCTIGMATEIDDEAARIFAASFYRALAFGKSVKGAFDEARVALLMEGFNDDAPQLLTRTGVEPDAVKLLQF